MSFKLEPPRKRIADERLFFHVTEWTDGHELYCNEGWTEVFCWSSGSFHWVQRDSAVMDDDGSCLFTFRCPGDWESRGARINGWKTVGEVGPNDHMGTIRMQGSSRIDCAAAQ